MTLRIQIPESWQRGGLVLRGEDSGWGGFVVGDPCVVRDEEAGIWRMFLFVLPPGHGFGLGFAVRLVTGMSVQPGSVGTYGWGGAAGTVFFVDPLEEMFALMMIQAPGQREEFQQRFRAMVYAALET